MSSRRLMERLYKNGRFVTLFGLMISKEIMLSDGHYRRVLGSELDSEGIHSPGYYLCLYYRGVYYTIRKYIIG